MFPAPTTPNAEHPRLAHARSRELAIEARCLRNGSKSVHDTIPTRSETAIKPNARARPGNCSGSGGGRMPLSKSSKHICLENTCRLHLEAASVSCDRDPERRSDSGGHKQVLGREKLRQPETVTPQQTDEALTPAHQRTRVPDATRPLGLTGAATNGGTSTARPLTGRADSSC